MTLGASATIAALTGASDASTAPAGSRRPSLQTRLFNFTDDVSAGTVAELTSTLKDLGRSPGVEGVLVGRNFIPTPFPTRFEWIYMIQFSAGAAPDQASVYREVGRSTNALSAHCRNEVQCDLTSPLPAGFARAVGVKVRHTVMFDFKPDASAEARERNVAAIRSMGKLPMVQRYVVERAAPQASGPTQMEWQVIGDFGSVDDYKAYSAAPVHLAIREDFTAHTSRVAFLDVEL
jgi:hypothetical protein